MKLGPNLTPLNNGWTWKHRTLELLFWPISLLLAPVIWVLSGNLLEAIYNGWDKVASFHDARVMKKLEKNREQTS